MSALPMHTKIDPYAKASGACKDTFHKLEKIAATNNLQQQLTASIMQLVGKKSPLQEYFGAIDAYMAIDAEEALHHLAMDISEVQQLHAPQRQQAAEGKWKALFEQTAHANPIAAQRALSRINRAHDLETLQIAGASLLNKAAIPLPENTGKATPAYPTSLLLKAAS